MKTDNEEFDKKAALIIFTFFLGGLIGALIMYYFTNK